jgi:hypothetical protein
MKSDTTEINIEEIGTTLATPMRRVEVALSRAASADDLPPLAKSLRQLAKEATAAADAIDPPAAGESTNTEADPEKKGEGDAAADDKSKAVAGAAPDDKAKAADAGVTVSDDLVTKLAKTLVPMITQQVTQAIEATKPKAAPKQTVVVRKSMAVRGGNTQDGEPHSATGADGKFRWPTDMASEEARKALT